MNFKKLAVYSLFGILAACGSSVRPYPLEDCLVTDNRLGSMGDVITIVHEGQEIKFCCAPCVKKFNADPQKYLAKLGK